jgi:hypothetical protein
MGGLAVTTGMGGNGGTRDAIYLSADTSTAALSGALDGSTVTGLGMTGVIGYSTTGGTALLIELGMGDDTIQVTDPTPSVAFIHGGPGTDAITCSAANCFAYPD